MSFPSISIGPFRTASRHSLTIPIALVLVAASDVLSFGFAPGLNVVLILIAIVASVQFLSRRPIRSETMFIAGLTILSLALVLESPGVASLTLAALAISIFSIERLSQSAAQWTEWPFLLARFSGMAPFQLIRDLFRATRWWLKRKHKTSLGGAIASWILPLGLGSVFLFLFRAANPIIDLKLSQIDLEAILAFGNAERIVFWCITATIIWALLHPRLMKQRTRQGATKTYNHPQRPRRVFGQAAILRALVLFNVLFGIQTALDLAYLWGGVALPAGMSYADYAHRGAYPLVFTALLAAVFVLGVMRQRSESRNNKAIRVLVYVWVVQNIWLCLSSILRLELYVEAYSLTVFRVAAGAWMALVAVGLALIVARIVLNRSNAWLVSTNLVSLVVVLGGFSAFDVPALVARYNVDHCAQMGGPGQVLDLEYLVSLGPTVVPALDRYLAALPEDRQNQRHIVAQERQFLFRNFSLPPIDWREWTFRKARLDAYLLEFEN